MNAANMIISNLAWHMTKRSSSDSLIIARNLRFREHEQWKLIISTHPQLVNQQTENQWQRKGNSRGGKKRGFSWGAETRKWNEIVAWKSGWGNTLWWEIPFPIGKEGKKYLRHQTLPEKGVVGLPSSWFVWLLPEWLPRCGRRRDVRRRREKRNKFGFYNANKKLGQIWKQCKKSFFFSNH